MGSWLSDIIDLGATLVGAGSDIYNSGKAADAQEDAANRSLDFYREIIDQNRADQAPWRDVGSSSLYQLAAGLGAEYEGAPGTTEERYATALNRFQESPGYAHQFGQGIEAIEAGAASAGLLDSGRTAKALTRFGQGLANQEWNAHQNRLASLAGIGQTATGQTGSQGLYGARGVAGVNQDAGQATASSYTGRANAINSGLENLAALYNPKQSGNG